MLYFSWAIRVHGLKPRPAVAARQDRFLNLPKLCIAETGNVTNQVHEPVLQHSRPCWWLYACVERCVAAERERLDVLVFAKDHWYPAGSFAGTSSASA